MGSGEDVVVVSAMVVHDEWFEHERVMAGVEAVGHAGEV